MSRKMLKVLILGAMVVSALASASSASAWTTNGPFGFTGTTGATRLTASPGPALNCSGPNDAVGNLFAKSSAASGLRLADVQPRFAGCTVSGLAFTVACTPLSSVSPLPAALNGASYSAGVTTGTLSNIRCTISIPNCSVVVTGTVNGTYNNTSFALTVLSTSQALAYTATGASCSALGFAASGSATYTNGTGGNAVYVVTSSPKPSVTNP
jgi:hypothetical protein